jgi:ethylmalonyl-CoA mutase
VPLVRDVLDRMRAAGAGDIPVIVGGIIPPDDVYTPKDFDMTANMADIVRLVAGEKKVA